MEDLLASLFTLCSTGVKKLVDDGGTDCSGGDDSGFKLFNSLFTKSSLLLQEAIIEKKKGTIKRGKTRQKNMESGTIL